MAKPNKNEIARMEVYDTIFKAFGDSAIGMVDKKLRVNVKDKDGNTLQFAIAATLSKTPVESAEKIETIESNELNFEDESPEFQELSTQESQTLSQIMSELNI